MLVRGIGVGCGVGGWSAVYAMGPNGGWRETNMFMFSSNKEAIKFGGGI